MFLKPGIKKHLCCYLHKTETTQQLWQHSEALSINECMPLWQHSVLLIFDWHWWLALIWQPEPLYTDKKNLQSVKTVALKGMIIAKKKKKKRKKHKDFSDYKNVAFMFYIISITFWTIFLWTARFYLKNPFPSNKDLI